MAYFYVFGANAVNISEKIKMNYIKIIFPKFLKLIIFLKNENLNSIIFCFILFIF